MCPVPILGVLFVLQMPKANPGTAGKCPIEVALHPIPIKRVLGVNLHGLIPQPTSIDDHRVGAAETHAPELRPDRVYADAIRKMILGQASMPSNNRDKLLVHIDADPAVESLTDTQRAQIVNDVLWEFGIEK